MRARELFYTWAMETERAKKKKKNTIKHPT